MPAVRIPVRRIGIEPAGIRSAEAGAESTVVRELEGAMPAMTWELTAISGATRSWSAVAGAEPRTETKAGESTKPLPESKRWKSSKITTCGCRTTPGIVESFPLGVESTAAGAIVGHHVGRIGRAIWPSQYSTYASIATGDVPLIG